MSQSFSPPINKRTNDELLSILNNDTEWLPEAVTLAKKELNHRGVELNKIDL